MVQSFVVVQMTMGNQVLQKWLMRRGAQHSCALTDSSVWGGNVEGQTDVPQLEKPDSLVLGKCWGNNAPMQMMMVTNGVIDCEASAVGNDSQLSIPILIMMDYLMI